MKAMDIVFAKARELRLLPIRRMPLPEGDDFGVVPIVAGNSIVSGGGRYQVKLDHFIGRLGSRMPDLVPGNSLPIRVNYFSTGRYDDYARRLKGMVRVLNERNAPLLVGESLAADANYRDLLKAGNQAVMMSAKTDDDTSRLFKEIVDDLLRCWEARAIPARVGLRHSMVLVSGCDTGGGPGLCVGRRHLLKKNELRLISEGLLPLVSAFNFVAAEEGIWYRIPGVPYGVTPGVRGFEILVGAAEMIDHEHIVRMRSIMDDSVLGEGKIAKHVRAPLPSPGEDGRMAHMVCGRHESSAPLVHLRFRDEDVEPFRLPAATTMMLVVPIEGAVEVGSSSAKADSIEERGSIDVQTGGAALLMPAAVSASHFFTISPLATPSAALVIKPYLFA